MQGFKAIPEVGNPLYAVQSQEEAKFIVNRVKQRSALEAARRLAASGKIQVHELKHKAHKEFGKLQRHEKLAIKGGDKSVLYEKLGLLKRKISKASIKNSG